MRVRMKYIYARTDLKIPKAELDSQKTITLEMEGSIDKLNAIINLFKEVSKWRIVPILNIQNKCLGI